MCTRISVSIGIKMKFFDQVLYIPIFPDHKSFNTFQEIQDSISIEILVNIPSLILTLAQKLLMAMVESLVFRKTEWTRYG